MEICIFWTLKAKPLAMLCASLSLFGFGEALLLKSQLGSSPWTVFAQGLSVQTGLNIGLLTFIISCGVLALWIPLKQRFGLGTILNICIIALSLGLFDVWLPVVDDLVWQILLAVLGVVIVGIASSLYLTSHMGAGPRDGLMVGLTADRSESGRDSHFFGRYSVPDRLAAWWRGGLGDTAVCLWCGVGGAGVAGCAV